jgi:ankyrin repeat protein
MTMPRTIVIIFLFLFQFLVTACTTPDLSSTDQTSTRNSRTNSEEAGMNLIEAAGSGNVETVKRLLEQGVDVNVSSANGVTPLIAAAYNNQIEIAELLIDAGADFNVKDDTQQSAYLISTSDGYLDLLRLTLSAGADVHSRVQERR